MSIESVMSFNHLILCRTLARLCGVSMPTLYQNLNPLMEEGLVCYSGEGVSTGGRKAQGLEIVPDARISVGISVTEHHLRLIAADLRLNKEQYCIGTWNVRSMNQDKLEVVKTGDGKSEH